MLYIHKVTSNLFWVSYLMNPNVVCDIEREGVLLLLLPDVSSSNMHKNGYSLPILNVKQSHTLNICRSYVTTGYELHIISIYALFLTINHYSFWHQYINSICFSISLLNRNQFIILFLAQIEWTTIKNSIKASIHQFMPGFVCHCIFVAKLSSLLDNI